jgi:hypothetical protein
MPEDPASSIRFSLTVRQDLVALAQDALSRECHVSDTSTVVEFIPQHEEARLWITMPAAAYADAIHVLIGELPAAEFGSVRHLQAEAQSASYKLAA